MSRQRENYKARIRLKRGEPGYATRSGGGTLAIRSLTETARILGCSRQAVHQVERTAIHKIRLALLEVVRETNPELYQSLTR